MDRPTEEEIKSKFLNFDELRKRVTPVPRNENPPVQSNVKTEEQKVAELQLDVGRLISSVVDLDRVIEQQARLVSTMIRAMVHMNNKIEGK